MAATEPVMARAAAPAPAPAPRRDATVTSRRVSPKATTTPMFGFRPAFQN